MAMPRSQQTVDRIGLASREKKSRRKQTRQEKRSLHTPAPNPSPGFSARLFEHQSERASMTAIRRREESETWDFRSDFPCIRLP